MPISWREIECRRKTVIVMAGLLAMIAPALVVAENNKLGKSSQNSAQATSSAAGSRILLVSTLDGQLHALSLEKGIKLWSLQSSPLLSSNLNPSLEGGDGLIAGIDGSLFYTSQKGIKRLKYSIRDLANAQPVKDSSTYYMVRKNSSVLLVSKTSGKVLNIISSDGEMSDEKGECLVDGDDDVVWVAKSEFKIQAIDSKSQRRRWDVSFGEYTSFFDASPFQSHSAGDGEGGGGEDKFMGAGKGGNRDEIHNPRPQQYQESNSLPNIGVSINGDIYYFAPRGGGAAGNTKAPQHNTNQPQIEPVWRASLNSSIAAVHLMGKGNDIYKIPHVYIHRHAGAAGSGNILALQEQHEVVFVAKKP